MPALDPSFCQSWFGEIPAVLPTRPACGTIRGAGARDAQNKWREKSAPRTRGQYREECLQVKRAATNVGKFAAWPCDMRLRRGMPAAMYRALSGPAPDGTTRGEVAEWSKAPHSKCGIRASVSWVRIPPSPPDSTLSILDFRSKFKQIIFWHHVPTGVQSVSVCVEASENSHSSCHFPPDWRTEKYVGPSRRTGRIVLTMQR
jgi:hypothetical protein